MRPIQEMQEQLRVWYGDEAPDLAQAMHFDITNVAEYSQEFGGKELSEISFAVPPWPFVCAEARLSHRHQIVYVAKTEEKDGAWQIRIHILAGTGVEFRGTIRLSAEGTLDEAARWECYVSMEAFFVAAVQARLGRGK